MFSRLYLRFLLVSLAAVLVTYIAAALLAGGASVLVRPSFRAGLGGCAAIVAVAAHFVAYRLGQSLDNLWHVARGLSGSDEKRQLGGDVASEISDAALTIGESGESLEQERQRLNDEILRISTVLQSMADGVLVVDDRYEILIANPACRDLLRLAAAPVVGRPLLEVTRLRTLYDAVGQCLSRPGSLTTELNVGDQNERHLVLRASRLPGDPCPGAVVVLHDVSEVRRLENIRKEFVANVSHELKTPLASIKAYAETLKMGAVNDPEHNLDFVSRIEDDANRLHQLITDMLQIARIESHQQAFTLRPIDVQPQVERCIRDMANRADAKGINLRITPPDIAVTVTADEEGLQTVLANLLDNAIKYTPDGGQVNVRWGQEADMMVLEVEDSGMGIEAHLQDRIFERFFRVDRARTRDIGGTGLGLSIVKHLVQAFHGSVSVHSQLGHGSRFQVRLPLVRPEKAAD